MKFDSYRASNELLFLAELIGSKIYGKALPTECLNIKRVDFTKLLDLALKNDILYCVAHEVLNLFQKELSPHQKILLQKIEYIGNIGLKNLHNTLRLLKSYMSQDYLVIKTYKVYPYLPSDVDILVDDFNQAVKDLMYAGMNVAYYFEKFGEAVFRKSGYTQVHLHKNISWHNSKFMDSQFAWREPKEVVLTGVKIRIPSNEVELLTHIAHINFELLYITLSDLVYLSKLMHQVDWSIMLHQVRRYGWSNTFKRTIIIMKHLYNLIFSACSGDAKGGDLSMPLELPRTHIISSFVEKRALNHVLTTIIKSLFILLSGKTYGKAKVPTEAQLFGTCYFTQNFG